MKQFWVFNISNSDVSLGDLNITIRSKTSVNLLKNSQITYEQALKSAESGSLFKKRNKIHLIKDRCRMHYDNTIKTLDQNAVSQRKERSIFNQKEEVFEEFLIIESSDKENEKDDENPTILS